MARWSIQKLVTATISFRISSDTPKGYRTACRALRKKLIFAESTVFADDAHVIAQVGRARVRVGKRTPTIRRLKGDRDGPSLTIEERSS
ncbi:MAG: hypothetical protein AAB263_11315 [Planctomycetota bacterium]